MSYISTKGDGTSALKRVIIYIFVGFCLFNHLIRALAGSSSIGPDTAGIPNIAGGFGSYAIEAFNDFRQGLGGAIGQLEHFCPAKVSKPCSGVIYGVKVVLGVH